MAKTLANAAECEEIRQRIAALTTESRRVWGSMSIGGMLCHVDDSYQVAMGDRPLSISKLAIPQRMAKFLALRSPFRWPRARLPANRCARAAEARRRQSLPRTAHDCSRPSTGFAGARN